MTLRSCFFLPDADERAFAKTRAVLGDIIICDDEEPDLIDEPAPMSCDSNSTRRVNVVQPPYLDVHYRHHALRLTLDVQI